MDNQNDWHVEKIEDAFETIDDALSAYNTNQYSILSEALQWPHKGEYEFLLQYPELSGFNRWTQTNFPLDENCTSGQDTVDGFQNISCTWIEQHWGGLCRSRGCSLLEGSINYGHWFYAIGTKKNCNGFGIRNIPGPNAYEVHEVYLWMRVSNMIIYNLFTYNYLIKLRTHFFTFLLFLCQ